MPVSRTVVLLSLAVLLHAVAGARIKTRPGPPVDQAIAVVTKQVQSLWDQLDGVTSSAGGAGAIDIDPLMKAYKCWGPNVAHSGDADWKLGTKEKFECKGCRDPAQCASAGLFLASSAAGLAMGYFADAVDGADPVWIPGGLARSLQISSSIVGMWADIPALEDVQANLADSVKEAAKDLKTFRFERGLTKIVAKSRVLHDRVEELKSAEVLTDGDCEDPRTSAWFSTNDRADEDAAYALADTLTHSQLFVDTMPADESTSAELLQRQLLVADGLSNVWAGLAMGRLNFLEQVSLHNEACPALYEETRDRIDYSLLTSAVNRYHRFSNVWTTHRAALSSRGKTATLAELEQLVAKDDKGDRNLTNVAAAAPKLIAMGVLAVPTLQHLLEHKDLAIVAAALEMRTLALEHPDLLVPFISQLVDIVSRPYNGDEEEQFYVGHVETAASRLLEKFSEKHAKEVGWVNQDKLQTALSKGIVRGQSSRLMIFNVIQRIVANKDAAKPEGAASAMMQVVAESHAELVDVGENTNSGDPPMSALNKAITSLTANVAQLGGLDDGKWVGFKTDIYGLLDTFNCAGSTETVNGSVQVNAFTCDGAQDFATVASSALAVASTVAGASGVGLPVAAVLNIASQVVGLWASRGPTLPEFQADVMLMLHQAVDEVKTFHLEYDLADAISKSIVLADHIEMVQRSKPVVDCDLPVAVARMTAIERIDEETSEAMAALLTEAELSVTMGPSEELGLGSLKRHVAIFDGFTNAWSNLAMGRLNFLTEAVTKFEKCERFSKRLERKMRKSLLGTVMERYHEHEKQLKVVRSAYEEKIFKLKVADIRYALESWMFPGYFEPETVFKYAPQLVQLGTPGAEFVHEFLVNEEWAVVDAVFGKATLNVLQADKKLILPLAADLAKVFLKPWKTIQGDSPDLAHVGHAHEAAANLLDRIPDRQMHALECKGIRTTLNAALQENNVRRQSAKAALERVIHRISEAKTGDC